MKVSKEITDKKYVKEALKEKIEKERKKIINFALRKTEAEDKIKEMKELKKKESIRKNKEKEKEELVMETLNTLIKSHTLTFDPCPYLIPRAIRLSITGQKDLMSVFAEGKKGNCLFYHSCKMRKASCGENIPKRKSSIFKD